MKYKGIIFDLDGVLCHTDKYHYQAWKVLADKLGIYFDEYINNRLRGVSRMESLEIILERHEKGQMTDNQKSDYADEKNIIYRGLLNQMTTKDLSDEVKTTLDKLRAAGLKLAIGSSSKNTPLILERIDLSDFFDAISDGNNITNSKPHPEVFIMAADFIKLKPNECLVVEDAEAGVDAAIAGHFDCAAIGDAVKCGKAKYNLATFSGLLDIIN